MNYNNYEILGSYSTRDGGSIVLSMGKNMVYNTELNTYIHEISHMYLNNCTNLGFILLILESELSLSERNKDYQHLRELGKIKQLISQRIEEVQEIFANNYELLWIEEYISKKARDKSYKMKTLKYKKYFDELKMINSKKSLNYGEKKRFVEQICMYSMNVPIFNQQFIDAFKSTTTLKNYFLIPNNNPNQRLKKALGLFKSNTDIKLDCENETIDLNKLLSALRESKVIKYIDINLPDFEEIEKHFMDNGEISASKIEGLAYKIQEDMDTKVKLFDFQNLKTIRVNNFGEYKSFGVFVIKNCNVLNDEVNNYYLLKQGRINKKTNYISHEINKAELHSYLQNFNVVGIPIYEFDLENMKPIYLKDITLPIVVLFDDYNHFKEAISKLLAQDELIVGDLYDAGYNNFFTVLIFRTRSNPNIIFVFPTLKKLSVKLLKELSLEDKILFSKDISYLNIMSVFEKEIKMLEFTFWIFSFLLNETSEHRESSAALNREIVSNLFSQTMQIRHGNSNYYSNSASLPTLHTVGEPFYVLMQFNNNLNTGELYVHSDHSGNCGIVFFHDKKSAENWKERNLNDPLLQAVGVDKVYWNALKTALLKTNINIILVHDFNESKGLLFDVSTFDFRYSLT